MLGWLPPSTDLRCFRLVQQSTPHWLSVLGTTLNKCLLYLGIKSSSPAWNPLHLHSRNSFSGGCQPPMASRALAVASTGQFAFAYPPLGHSREHCALPWEDRRDSRLAIGCHAVCRDKGAFMEPERGNDAPSTGWQAWHGPGGLLVSGRTHCRPEVRPGRLSGGGKTACVGRPLPTGFTALTKIK